MTRIRSTRRTLPVARRARAALGVLGCASALALGACDLLDVSNPNNVSEEALNNPAGAGPLVNGLVASTVRGVNAIMTSYATATDELEWIGSRDGWQQIDRGDFGDPFNEFTDNAFKYVAEARFMANNAMARLEGFGFNSADALADQKSLMVRAYTYSAIIYLTIGDQFDDFAFSDKTVAGANVGPENMAQFYDSAIVFLDKAEALAQTDDEMATVLMLRARAKHDRAMWVLLNPSSSTPPANPLVNDAGANADATAALAIVGNEDVAMELVNNVSLNVGDLSIGGQVNQRQEMIFDRNVIVYYDPSGENVQDKIDSIRLRDPVSGLSDPYVTAFIRAFVDADAAPSLIAASSREMRLILAEAALAAGSTTEFDTHINAVRAMDGLPAYTGAGVSRQDLLIHHRRSSLFLQGRRLADLHRFGIMAAEWAAEEPGPQCKGLFFPITVTELQSNPLVTSVTGCGH
jgi:hypothetical protein